MHSGRSHKTVQQYKAGNGKLQNKSSEHVQSNMKANRWVHRPIARRQPRKMLCNRPRARRQPRKMLCNMR